MKRSNIDNDVNDSLKILSHDLKSPMITIFGFVEDIQETIRLKEDLKKEDFKKIYEDLDKIKSVLRYSSDLINDILGLYIDNKKIQKRLIEFRLILSEVLQTTILNHNKNLVIKIESKLDDKVYVNPVEIKEVLRNVITNSIKYKRDIKSSFIKIGKLKSEDDNYHCFYIKDNGIGMSEDRLKQVNEFVSDENGIEFQQSLGLSIMKKLMKKNNGKIFVASEGKNKGINFYLSIPKNKDIFNE